MNTKQHTPIDGVTIYKRQQLAKALRVRRLEIGLSLMEVAAKTGLSFSTVYFAEKLGNVSARTAHALAPVYDLNVEAVLELSHPARRTKKDQEH